MGACLGLLLRGARNKVLEFPPGLQTYEQQQPLGLFLDAFGVQEGFFA